MTIYALSSGPGISGVAVIRLSGKDTSKAIKFLTGKAGSAFLIDSYGLHSGTKLLKGERFSTWIRFGRKFNAATIQDGRATS